MVGIKEGIFIGWGMWGSVWVDYHQVIVDNCALGCCWVLRGGCGGAGVSWSELERGAGEKGPGGGSGGL